MAENPATWTAAEKVVHGALRDHDEAMAKGIVGRSSVRAITDALREAGLLKEEPGNPSGILRKADRADARAERLRAKAEEIRERNELRRAKRAQKLEAGTRRSEERARKREAKAVLAQSFLDLRETDARQKLGQS